MSADEDLLEAAEDGKAKAVAAALEAGADVNARDDDANTALHLAVRRRKLEIAELLLGRGADLEAKGETDETPLMAVLRSESGVLSKKETTNALWLLERGADVHTSNEYGQSPLHLAAASGSKTLIKALVERGAKVTTHEDVGNPLHGCIDTTDKDSELWDLLLDLGCDLEDRCEGDTVLHTAQVNWNRVAVKYFLSRGADVHARDDDGKTALQRARDLGQKKIVPILEKAGG